MSVALGRTGANSLYLPFEKHPLVNFHSYDIRIEEIRYSSQIIACTGNAELNMKDIFFYIRSKENPWGETTRMGS